MIEPGSRLVVPEFGIDQPRERALLAHYDCLIGARRPVLTCIREKGFHLDIHLFEPTAGRPYITLATVGMSFRSMKVPSAVGEEPRDRVELVMYLQPEWDFDSPVGAAPLEALSLTARYPWQHDTYFSPGDSIPPGDRLAVPGSLLTATFFGKPPKNPAFQHLDFGDGDGTICHFLWEIPITDAELYLKLNEGPEAFEQRLHEAGYRTLDVDRQCLASDESRGQRRAREKALRRRDKLPKKRTFKQVACELHDHTADAVER